MARGSRSSKRADAAIVAEGVTKRFGKVEALRGLDLSVPANGIYGLLGPNGAGKTTAVRIFTTIFELKSSPISSPKYSCVGRAKQYEHA